jgi:hypothetical protein
MESIREAIIGFAQANGRLPCPADGTVAAGAAGAGTEQVVGTTCAGAGGSVFFGVVPWATLGVPEVDGWGRRFSYWVSPIFADGLPPTVNTWSSVGQSPTCAPTPTPIQSSFALCSQGVITVNTRNESTHAPTALGSQLPAVIISHGKNGSGAYTPAGSILPAPAGADETSNQTHANTVTTFYSRIPTPAASSCNDGAVGTFCEFDDIVVMITSNNLIARMVAAGKLP